MRSAGAIKAVDEAVLAARIEVRDRKQPRMLELLLCQAAKDA
jgi:hypothetical protein